jgi:GTP cyclohydrolase I
MQDTQNFSDKRMIKIAKVGIKKLRHPIFFLDEKTLTSPVEPLLSTTACFSFFVELPATKKGTHMSRFPTLLYDFAPYFSLTKFEAMAQEINTRLESQKAFVECEFLYFYQKPAPISQTPGLAEVSVSLEIQATRGQTPRSTLRVKVPVKSLCPCSKAISEFGAHSQRSYVQISVLNPTLSLQECIAIAERSSSSAVYPVLKRIDEKYVTEHAYHNPRFVEDIVREGALQLKERLGNGTFEICAENFESIHHHNAWAQVSSDDL